MSNGASNGANTSRFNAQEDIIAFCNGASNVAHDQVHEILKETIHDTVDRDLN